MNISLRWVLPSTRVSGKPLLPADIKHVEIGVSANGGTSYTRVGLFPPTVLSTNITDLDFGTWKFQGVVVDKLDRASAPLVATYVNEDTSPPSALVSLTPVPA